MDNQEVANIQANTGLLNTPKIRASSMSSTPSPAVPSRPLKEMSSGLRERLKRCSRYSVSAVTPKRPRGSPLSSTPSQLARPALLTETPETQSCLSPSTGRCYELGPDDQQETLDSNDTADTSVEFSPLKRVASFSADRSSDKISSASSVSPADRESAAVQQKDSCTVLTESTDHLRKEKVELQQRVAAKEEQLRKLNLVKMHQSKNSLDTLQTLTNKWRAVVQEVLTDLWRLRPEPRPSMTEFIGVFQLDHSMIGYNAEDMSFT